MIQVDETHIFQMGWWFNHQLDFQFSDPIHQQGGFEDPRVSADMTINYVWLKSGNVSIRPPKPGKNTIQDRHQIHQLQSPIFLPCSYHLPDPCGFFGRLPALPRLAKWCGHLWSVEVVDVIDASNQEHERNFIPAFFRDDSTIKGGFNQLHGLPWYFFLFWAILVGSMMIGLWMVYPSDFRSSVEGALVVCKGVSLHIGTP